MLPIMWITRIPQSPDFLRGSIQLRKEIIPIVDLNKILGLPVTPPTFATKIVILQLPKKKPFGVIVAKVERIEHSKEKLYKLLRNATIIKGVYTSHNGKIQVLDSCHLLTEKEQQQLLELRNE